ncbi:MAG: hypothetical protein LBK95_04355 [Bifidobacteriaceae bacterium]|jgi:hypothetical protein|nr:hypothetical protein [Bifidobacteriaceae bacterium]
MNARLIARTPIVVMAAFVGLITAGCGGDGETAATGGNGDGTGTASADVSQGASQQTEEASESPEPPQEPTLDGVELQWNGYTMGIEQVTDDPEKIFTASGVDLEGKALKICFAYISDPANSGGFASGAVMNDLATKPIVILDASGTVYEFTGSVGDIAIKSGDSVDQFGIEELQERFSVTFDVPTSSSVEDFQLRTDTGDSIRLMPYVSDAYAADSPDSA